ncbi:MAG: hypothetical protein RL557_548 [archaeon]|jgi:uncharacterized membrane protein YkoI
MREKLVLGVVLLGAILVGTFIVAAFAFGNTEAPLAKTDMKAGLSVVDVSDSDEATDGEDEESEMEDAHEIAITGNALEEASAAALAYIGEGRVTDTELDDEEGYYEIEITLADGREVDVHLDETFKVLSTEYD